jgi:uncharacterized protein (TIGR00251 family)
MAATIQGKENLISLEETDDGISFLVRVVPRASKTEIVGEHDHALKVRIASPPVDGAANDELIRLLAKRFRVSKSDIEIESGQNSKNKKIKIANLSQSSFEEKLK